MVGVDDMAEKGFRLAHQLFVKGILRTGDDELFDDPWQSLGKDDIGRFGLLVLIVMQQLNDEREAMEGVALQAGFGAGAFAELDALVKRPQVAAYFGRKTLSLLEKRFEIRFERQHDLLRFGIRVQLGISGNVIEENQCRFPKCANDTLALNQ